MATPYESDSISLRSPSARYVGSGQKKLVSTVAGRSGITTVPLRLAFSPGCTCCSFPVPLPSSLSFPHPRHCLQTDTFQIKISAVAALIKSPYSPLLPPESSSQNWPRLCSLPFCCPLPLASPDHAPSALSRCLTTPPGAISSSQVGGCQFLQRAGLHAFVPPARGIPLRTLP